MSGGFGGSFPTGPLLPPRRPPANINPAHMLSRFGGVWLPNWTPSPTCTCGVGIQAQVHRTGCDPKFIFDMEPEPKPVTPGLWLPHGVKPRRKPRRTTKRGVPREWPKSYRLLLAFSFTRPVDVQLWKRIKAPKGWRKNPTSDKHQTMYRGVRFRCDDLKYALTPDDVEELRAKLYLILREVF